MVESVSASSSDSGTPRVRSSFSKVGDEGSHGGKTMARIAILYCKRIKDHSCIACANCYQGIHDKNGEFARHDDIDLVAMTDCGDCPGLVVPRVKLLTEVAKGMGRDIETLHLGTCVKAAMETADCPIDYDALKVILEKKFKLQVVLGTYSNSRKTP
jgi:predicted metal-binding protein